MTMRDGWLFLMVHPPVKKSFVRNDVETLIGGRSLCKCIGNISTIDEEILCHRAGVEDSGTCLIHSISIRLIKYAGLTGTR
jgi:hypothetical protein